jgi:phage terminase large subunit
MTEKKSKHEQMIEEFASDILAFVNICIIEPYNESTNSNFFITNQQRKALLALQDLVLGKEQGKYKDIFGISIMSGRGTGKDAWTVWVMLWFMFCFPFPKVPCVSVSADQLNKVLWSEISKWLSHSKVREYFVLQQDKLYFKDVKDSVRGREWFAFPKAANPKLSPDEQVESLAGLHADYMMEVLDEVSGILDPVCNVLENNMTGLCNFMVLIFNPMHTKGYAKRTQYEDKENWITFRWNAEESEITNKEKIKQKEKKYGRDSNTFRMNVLGLPPVFDTETLIDPDWVMAAIDRPLEILPSMPLVEAMDCGAGGDKSIIGGRRGNKLYPFKRNNTSDSVELTNWAGTHIDKDKPDVFRVDTVGIGWAVEGALRDKKGAIIEPCDVRRKADNSEQFANKRAEMYWTLRMQFEAGTISIPNDTEFIEQLCAIKYETTKSGQTQIQDKRQIKKEIGHSPDESDTAAMLYYYDDIFLSRAIEDNEERIEVKGTWAA